ncbi:MAG TPA: peptidoglycan DD-metalloendopeptidase family protein [Ignavibacteriaceae bacterium]|nr:peptidoglycan DD-metalloendopeptidase family protein [Ignavibacteriaceae bacterium]
MVSRSFIYSLLFLISLFLFSPAYIQAQNSAPADEEDQNSINQKKEELSRLKKEISSLEEEIKAKAKKEKKTGTILENFSRQSFLLNKLINKLQKEEQGKQDQIEEIQFNINSLEKEIKSIQDNYSKYIVAIYKSGKNSEWAALFNSSSVQQALLRYKYLNEFSERRQESLKELKDKKEKLKAEKIILNKEVKEKESLTNQKLGEKKILAKKIKERKKILNTVRHDKKALANELKLKKSSEGNIREIIKKLVEQTEMKKERYAELSSNPAPGVKDIKTEEDKKRESEILYSPDISSFADLKGKMNWPVSNGKIISSFGESRNKLLNTVTINYGIDIQPGSDYSVKSVSQGIVSAVEWIPGYGSVVIITHNEDFRTVYGHLSEILVEEGDEVKAGQVIAAVAEDLEGRVLHFEIWNSRINQDPEIWLSRK